MLELINQARAEAGVPPVVMGTNQVAQIQAEALLRDCTLSHWGTDGLKPYMRYSLAGGYQVNKETATTANECKGNVSRNYTNPCSNPDTNQPTNSRIMNRDPEV